MAKAQSLIRSESSGSARVFWLDRQALAARVKEAAARLATERPEVLEVWLFGSAANGRAVPGSDADVAIVVASSQRRFIDRPRDYMLFFEDIGIGVDLLVYTEAERRSDSIPLLRSALASGIRLA
jgi:predicted nucleotidyltransferase